MCICKASFLANIKPREKRIMFRTPKKLLSASELRSLSGSSRRQRREKHSMNANVRRDRKQIKTVIAVDHGPMIDSTSVINQEVKVAQDLRRYSR